MSGLLPSQSEKQNHKRGIEPATACDHLRQLLQTQLELARQGRIGEMESLSAQNRECVEALREVRAVDPSAFAAQRRLLAQLYEQLCLTLAAQGQEIAESLTAIVQGKRLLRAYGRRVS